MSDSADVSYASTFEVTERIPSNHVRGYDEERHPFFSLMNLNDLGDSTYLLSMHSHKSIRALQG